jgi:hypothetical protein
MIFGISWAFLLASLRSRRAAGYAIASVLTAPCVQARMPYACLTQTHSSHKTACLMDNSQKILFLYQ